MKGWAHVVLFKDGQNIIECQGTLLKSVMNPVFHVLAI